MRTLVYYTFIMVFYFVRAEQNDIYIFSAITPFKYFTGNG